MGSIANNKNQSNFQIIMIELRLLLLMHHLILPSGTQDLGIAKETTKNLLTTIETSWSEISKQLDEVEYIQRGGWHPSNHITITDRYKSVRTHLTFAEAISPCRRIDGYLLYGNKDILKYMTEIPENTEIWFSTKDTRALRAVIQEDVNKFSSNIGTCYTIKHSSLSVTASEVQCDSTHRFVCMTEAEQVSDLYHYQQDIETMKKMAKQITTQDAQLAKTIKRVLSIGNPADPRHPQGLQQTNLLLTNLDATLNALNTNIPATPAINKIALKLARSRNTALIIVTMITAQHMENYASQVETISRETSNLKTQIAMQNNNKLISKAQSQEGSGLNEPNSTANSKTLQNSINTNILRETTAENANKLNKLATDIDGVTFKLNTIQTEQEEQKLITQSNRQQTKTLKRKNEQLSNRLNTWIENNVKSGGITTSNNTTTVEYEKLTKLVVEFMQDEEYVWAALALTIIFTVAGLINIIITCIYIKKASKRNTRLKTRLQLSPKYTRNEEVETTFQLNGSRLEQIEERVMELEKKTLLVKQQIAQIVTQQSGNSKNKKKNKNTAPTPPARK